MYVTKSLEPIASRMEIGASPVQYNIRKPVKS